MSDKEQYVVVTAISTHRMRYVVPMSELQKMNTDYQVDPKWALDAVTMQEVKEFSQHHIGEQITDMFVMGEEEVLDLFDKDNEYASSWSKEYKLAWIQHWEENPSDERSEEFEKIRQEHFTQRQERYHDYMTRMIREENDDKSIYSHGMTTPGDRTYET